MFKLGDQVLFDGRQGVVTDGPHGFTVALVYVVLFHNPPDARLVHAHDLKPYPAWVPCPGEHRAVASDGLGIPLRGTDWERRQT